jgi:hypothetical protein
MRVGKGFLIMTVSILSVTLVRGARIPGEIPFKFAQKFGIVCRVEWDR